ncbi:c-type cytochrome domain-containing protein [Flavivirga spongiicola]|uniref:Cytochrome C Planctomycete-type domain-containing protein n=1 Tax=Flavivirga spongiicola TaxID=421621 RepID=A0ABU7XYW4_9FLAO|nr:c-type cytochrome domain-containing protein [Flavivirga sp. MEBiC05379]MDO5980762.1 c-type cytochrome domain-containing protein [Flavivirga sp. MEBiC05379]
MVLNILLNIDSDTPSDIILFLGRIHPLVVHLPIGFLLLAGLAEISTKWTKFEPIKAFVQYIWGLGVIGAFFAVLFGYFLSLSGDYNEDTIFWHKWSGVAVLLFSLACYYISKKQIKIPFYGKSILVTIVVVAIFYTGHLGGNLTHGSTYLLEYAPNPVRQLAGLSKKAIPRKKVTVLDSADVYLDLVSPIMNNRCVSCHNEDKKKGDLNLTSFSYLMKGGENGEAIIPGDPNSSDLFRRITLPTTHDDFMPTEGKRPLTDDEVAFIGWWINNNAPSRGYFTALKPDKEMIDNVSRQLGLDKNNFLREMVQSPKKEIIDSLSNQGFILNLLMKDNYFLEANFSLSEKKLTMHSVESLLQIKDQLIWLNMSNSNVTDGNLEKIGRLENLIKLNLSGNKISDNGLVHLEKLKNLESLNLFNTEVSIGLLAVIPKLTHLRTLYLSESNATNEIVSELQKGSEKLKISFD